jgi:hypothetical protein
LEKSTKSANKRIAKEAMDKTAPNSQTPLSQTVK